MTSIPEIRFLIGYLTRQLTDFEVYGISTEISNFTPDDLKELYKLKSLKWLLKIKKPDNKTLAAIAWFGYEAARVW
ncbi:hypothetical protein ACHAPQ_004064 [Fusarium lateritium]